MTEVTNKPMYRLIEDHAIVFNDNTDLLNSSIYVELLEETVGEAANKNGVETIGLAGGWGSGKSSILESYKKRIQGKKLNGKDIRIQTFNAWKYSKDDFRKSFLLDVEENESERKKLEKDIYHQITMPKYSLLKLEPKETKFLGIIIGIILLAMVLLWFIRGIDSVIDGINLVLSCFGVTIGGFAIALIKSLFVEDKVTVIKAFTTIEFSEKFSEIIKKSNKFNIFIIDDLDRCKSEQALDILEIIHSYLKSSGNNNYLFIIPIDKDKIEKFLKSDRKYDNDDVDQYFAKIFDYEIIMSKPGSRNLYNMVEKINNDYGFNLSSMAISLISDYLIRTPRDIKKHFNSINILRMENCKKSSLKGFSEISDNEIVKIYILKKLWPRTYADILVKSNLTNNLDRQLATLNPKDIVFRNFLRMSNTISIKRIFDFEYLNDYGREIKIEIQNAIMHSSFEQIKANIEEEIWTTDEIADHIVYQHKTYIIERNLEKQFIGQIINIYCWFINEYGYSATKLSDAIQIGTLLPSLLKVLNDISQQFNGDEKLEELYFYYSSFINNFIQFIRKNSSISEVKRGANTILNATNGYMLFDLTLKFLSLDCSLNNSLLEKSRVKESIIQIINSGNNAYDQELASCVNVNTLVYFEEESLLETIIDNEFRNTIAELLAYGVSFSEEQNKAIISFVNFDSYIIQNVQNWDEERKKEFVHELFYLSNIMSRGSDILIQQVYDTQFSDFNKIVRFCKNFIDYSHDEDNENILSEIVKIIALIDNYYDDGELIHRLISEIKLDNEYYETLLGCLSYYKDDIKNCLAIGFMCIDAFSDETCEKYFNDMFISDNNIAFHEGIVKCFYDEEDISLNFEVTGDITIGYKPACDNLIKHINEFPIEIFKDILESIDLNVLLNNEAIMGKITTEGSEIKDIIVERIDTIEQCETALEYIKFTECKKEYHQIIAEIIDDANSVTELLRIHNLKTDEYVTNRIKDKMNEEFPDGDRSGFTKIGWEQDI